MAVTSLILTFGDSKDKGFLIEETPLGFRLLDSREFLSGNDRQSAVYFFKKAFFSKFEQTLLVNDELAAFEAAIKGLSATGETLLIKVGSQKSLIGIGSFGRVEIKSQEIGLGKGSLKLLKEAESLTIIRWLERTVKFDELENYLANKSLYPGLVPISKLELEIEQAAATEIIRFLKSKFWPGRAIPRRIILAGSVFSQAPKNYEPLLAFLNGFEPEGFCRVFLDVFGILPALGQVALVEEGKAINWEEQLLALADVLGLTQTKRGGEELGELILDLGFTEKQRIILKSGELVTVPYEGHQSGSVFLNLKNGVNFNSGLADISLSGGKIGIVIDGRGRPLPYPQLDSESRQRVKGWREALGG